MPACLHCFPTCGHSFGLYLKSIEPLLRFITFPTLPIAEAATIKELRHKVTLYSQVLVAKKSLQIDGCADITIHHR